ncbi:MAG TPA: hypothetical protein VMT93_01145 [Gemmatimonadaceae bacterium]|nr:hypothetical protein [Gemmatimonadaceae bacterium]
MKRSVLGLMLACAAAMPAAAQGVHLGITGGWYIPYGTVKDYATNGWDGGLTLAIGAPMVPVTFRIDGMYGTMPGKTVTVGPETVKADFTTWSLTGNLVWTIIGKTLPTKFYLIGGIGYYNVQQKYTTSAAIPIPTVNTPAFGYNAGLGFRFTKIFIEARWTNIDGGLDLTGLTAGGGTKSLQVVPVNVGIIF